MNLSGAKLAPFNSGGVCQNCYAKADDALQRIFISGHYCHQKCWQLGVGVEKFYGHKPVKCSKGQKNVSIQIPVNHG